MDSLNYAYFYGELSNTQKQAVITLIKKKDKDGIDQNLETNISRLNVDVKIGSKAIAKRIEKVLPSVSFIMIKMLLSRDELYLMQFKQ